MSKTTQTTRTVKITDFVEAHPPSILISEAVPGPSGRLRLFTQKVQVPDIDLWKKLVAEVEKGETIQVTVKTVWPDSGPYFTCLDSFSRVGIVSASARATASV